MKKRSKYTEVGDNYFICCALIRDEQDLMVNSRANRLGKAAVVQRSGISSCRNDGLVYFCVHFIGRLTHLKNEQVLPLMHRKAGSKDEELWHT